MKGLIIFKGKYGATRQYAEWLGAALKSRVIEAESETPEQLADTGYLVLGTSIYIGKYQLQSWIAEHAELLSHKRIFLFVVSGTPANKRKKLEEYFRSNIPAPIRKNIRCFHLPGRLEVEKLSLKDKILLKIGALLAKQGKGLISVADYNEVKKEHIQPLVDAIRTEIFCPAYN